MAIRGEIVRELQTASTLITGNYWFLRLPQAICTVGGDSQIDESNVTKIQLVVTSDQYERFDDLVGSHVVAEGTLFAWHTGHHFTPVLLDVGAIRRD